MNNQPAGTSAARRRDATRNASGGKEGQKQARRRAAKQQKSNMRREEETRQRKGGAHTHDARRRRPPSTRARTRRRRRQLVLAGGHNSQRTYQHNFFLFFLLCFLLRAFITCVRCCVLTTGIAPTPNATQRGAPAPPCFVRRQCALSSRWWGVSIPLPSLPAPPVALCSRHPSCGVEQSSLRLAVRPRGLEQRLKLVQRRHLSQQRHSRGKQQSTVRREHTATPPGRPANTARTSRPHVSRAHERARARLVEAVRPRDLHGVVAQQRQVDGLNPLRHVRVARHADAGPLVHGLRRSGHGHGHRRHRGGGASGV